jgi:hypothetical protein
MKRWRDDTMSAKKNNQPFKMFDCKRKTVFLLPSAAFKVWMYHYSMEGPTRESWPKLETICEALNMDEKTVKRQRRALLLHGWLTRTGSKRSKESGKFSIPVMRVKEGIIPEGTFYPPVEHKAPRVKTPPRTRGKKAPADAGYKCPTEVEPEKQVDIKKQVDSCERLEHVTNSQRLEVSEAGTLNRSIAPQGINAPTAIPVKPQGINTPTVIPVGQLVTSLPHEEGMKWWRKCNQGTTYEQHRAEIEAAVIEYQKIQEAQHDQH